MDKWEFEEENTKSNWVITFKRESRWLSGPSKHNMFDGWLGHQKKAETFSNDAIEKVKEPKNKRTRKQEEKVGGKNEQIGDNANTT